MTRLVVIESPYAGNPEYVKANVAYLHACIRDCVDRGESPYASHLMLTTALDDEDPDERALGIELGLAWRHRADLCVFYVDRGWSRGMEAARERYVRESVSYQVRKLRHGLGFSV